MLLNACLQSSEEIQLSTDFFEAENLNAFGFLKGRWRILTQNSIRNPEFMRNVALVCIALHNTCHRGNCMYDTQWDVQPVDYVRIGPALPAVRPEDNPAGAEIRFAVACSLQ